MSLFKGSKILKKNCGAASVESIARPSGYYQLGL